MAGGENFMEPFEHGEAPRNDKTLSDAREGFVYRMVAVQRFELRTLRI